MPDRKIIGKTLPVVALFLTRTLDFAASKLNKVSFSFLKRNFFKFGIEYSLLALALVSAVFAISTKSSDIFRSQNRYMAFLNQHRELNRQITEAVKTENLNITVPERSLVQKAEAVSLDRVESGVDQGGAQNKTQKISSESVFLVSADGSLIKPNYATKDTVKKRDIEDYTVKNGDSLNKIASSFGVSTQTIMYENKIGNNDYIKPGQVLKILPTNGIKHTVKKGETIASIAKLYKVEEESILEFNQIEVPEDIDIGEELIIPDAKIQIPENKKTKIASYNRVDVTRASVPQNFVGGSSLVWPLGIRNITQYFSSRHKGLDISNSQRPQFWAAAAGIIELSGWDGGYGRSIIINHGNGLKTRYGHASELYVTAGDRVEQGQVIGRVGNTGRAYGVTGNHLHFEVIKNSVKVDPLKVAR